MICVLFIRTRVTAIALTGNHEYNARAFRFLMVDNYYLVVLQQLLSDTEFYKICVSNIYEYEVQNDDKCLKFRKILQLSPPNMD